MSRLLDVFLGRDRQRFGPFDDDAGWTTLFTTYGQPDQERILPTFEMFAAQAYASNSVIFSLVSRRLNLFSEARFKFRALSDKHLYGTPALGLLERPWPNGTTSDLLARMEQDVSMAGNCYIRNAGDRLERLRPDWVSIISHVTRDDAGRQVRELAGYLYEPSGDPDRETELYLVDEVAHYTLPMQPLMNFTGTSWIGTVLRELDADIAMTKHRDAFFRNAASPNLAIKYQSKLNKNQRDEVRDAIQARHAGSRNAFGTLVLDSGADIEVIGDRMQGSAFMELQAAGMGRMAMAAGVPSLIAGMTSQVSVEGAYVDAMRAFADLAMRPAWRSACGALATLITVPAGSELWFDTSDISALRPGEKDAADAMQVQASTTNTLIMAGYKPDAVVSSVVAGDLSLLAGAHSGLTSVQMHKPGETGADKELVDAESVLQGEAQKTRPLELPPSRPGRHRADTGPHTSAMVALIPTDADAARLAVDDGEPVSDLHVTLVFLGDASGFDPSLRHVLCQAVAESVDGEGDVNAEVFARSAFNPAGDEPCLVLGIGGDQVADVHDAVLDAVTATLEDAGVLLHPQHQPWVAHLTLAYTDDLGRLGDLSDRIGPVTFDRVRLAFAGSHTDIPLRQVKG